METRTIYLENSDQTEFESAVIAILGDRVALGETAFHPREGGEPGDVGTITIDGEEYRVTEVLRQGKIISHRLDRAPQGKIGTPVRGIVDAGVRANNQRVHTGLHVLNGVVYHTYGARVTGGQVQQAQGRHDFDFPSWQPNFRGEIETAMQRIVAEDRPVIIEFIPWEEVQRRGDELIRTANRSIPHAPQVRIVTIEGLDSQACGGVHVHSTGEIGAISIRKVDGKGGNNRRIVIEVSDR